MDSPDATNLPEPRALLMRVVGGAVLVVGSIAGLGLVLRDPVTALGEWFVSSFGLLGVFAGVFLCDIMPISLHDPFLVAGHSGGLEFFELAATAISASLLASFFDYGLGATAGHRIPAVRGFVERYRIGAFMHRYGPSAMMFTAVMPFPFTVMAWAAGMAGVPLYYVLAASLLRGAKILFMLTLIVLGWEVGG
jgi:membrane protein YqaA with SNARE-associated domain